MIVQAEYLTFRSCRLLANLTGNRLATIANAMPSSVWDRFTQAAERSRLPRRENCGSPAMADVIASHPAIPRALSLGSDRQ